MQLYRVTILAAILLQLIPAPAVDYSTANTEALNHFWSAVGNSNRPVTVLSFGDSMADSYRSPSYHLMNKLVARFGSAGYSLNTYKNTALWNLENGAATRGPDYYWFTTYHQVPAGGALWWANQPTPNGTLCDRAGIFFVSQTNGGQFRLLLSTNGGPWTTALTLNGHNLSPQGHFTNVALPLNRYRLRVESDSGTNFIIGPSTYAAHTNGIHVAFSELGGISLGQVTNVPLAVRTPILAGLNPDLLLWHMKEDSTLVASNRMVECEAWWKNAAPNCDVIYMGTTWVAPDTNTTTTLDQNAIVRNIALRHHRAYVDLMTPTISYPWLLTSGFMQDTVHLNTAGGLHCANIMWDDLGFYALGLNRRITLQPNGPQLQLSYQVTTNAWYRLERSTNLHNWVSVLTNAAGSATFTTNLTSSPGPVYYRLGLTPR